MILILSLSALELFILIYQNYAILYANGFCEFFFTQRGMHAAPKHKVWI